MVNQIEQRIQPKTSASLVCRFGPLHKVLAKAALIAVMMAHQGCYQYRVCSAKSDPSTPYSKKNINSFLWGAVQSRTNGVDVVTANCDALNINTLAEVRVSTNFGCALVTVLTLGIWCPMQVEWKCAKPCQREGTIP